MSESYSSFCDDSYFDMYINTELDLPDQRDTILAFFERIGKQFPSMTNFHRRQNNEYFLEEDRDHGQYRWVSLETNRICSGVVNPSNLEDIYNQDKLVLDIIPYMLSVSHLDISSMDVTIAMDFDYEGNHDEIISEALFAGSALTSLLDLPDTKAIDFSPAFVIALSDDCCTQARVSIESKTTVYYPGKQKYDTEEAICLSFTIRQYPRTGEKFDSLKSFENQCRLAHELMDEKIIPNFVRPLTNVIAQKRLT